MLAVLVIAALALLTISFRSPTSGALHDAQGAGASALRPFQVAAERVARPFRDVYGYFHGLTTAKSQNEKLRREVQALRAQDSGERGGGGAGAGVEEDAQVRGRADVSAGLPSGQRERDLVPGRSLHAADRHRCGIALRHPAEHPRRHRGRARRAGHERLSETSVVTLITDADSAVAAKDLTTGVTGLVRRGTGQSLILDRVPKDQVVNKGDRIVTQGTRDPRYPDIYPYGIPIGKVLSVGYSDNAIFVQVQVAPYAQFGSFDSVTALVSTKPAPTLP